MEKILQTIRTSANEKSGISIPALALKTETSIENLKPFLRELHREGKIIVREGINAKLLFPR